MNSTIVRDMTSGPDENVRRQVLGFGDQPVRADDAGKIVRGIDEA
jgi:hypothetical protein